MKPTLSYAGKVTGRMWLGMDSTAIYNPNRRNRHEIFEAVKRACRVTLDDLVCERRDKTRVRSRFLAAYFLRVCTTLSMSQIGWALGGRDHSTICNGIERIKNRSFEFEPELSAIAAELGMVAPFPPAKENPRVAPELRRSI